MVGQAGDRSDEAIRGLARAAWSLSPDYVVLKEMDEYLRGRAPGEVSALLEQEFVRLAFRQPQSPAPAPTSPACGWLDGPGRETCWVAVHQDRDAIIELLNLLVADVWRAGEPLPAAAVSYGVSRAR